MTTLFKIGSLFAGIGGLELGLEWAGLGRVALEHQPKGSLNPDWVEALMGFSPGWTDGLPDEAKPSTRGNRRASRRKRTKDGSG